MKLRPVLWLLIVSQGILLVIELATRYDTFGRQNALSLTNVIGVIGILWFDRWLARRGGQLSVATLLIVIGAIWLDAMGNFQHLYAGYWWYDRLSHAAGGMAVSALFIDLFLTEQRRGRWTTGRQPAIWFGFLLGQSVAAFYEISEWLGDWWFGTERVRGLFDAPRDLLFNLVGGLLIVFLFFINRTKNPE